MVPNVQYRLKELARCQGKHWLSYLYKCLYSATDNMMMSATMASRRLNSRCCNTEEEQEEEEERLDDSKGRKYSHQC